MWEEVKYTYDAEHFGNDVFYDPTSLVNPYNITTKGTGGILFSSVNPKINGDLSIDNSSVELYNSTPEIAGILKITGLNTNWVKIKSGSTTNKINLNLVSSKLLINSSSSSITHPTNIFTNNEINTLELNFQSGGTFLIANDITIKTNLILSQSSNYLAINDKTLTINGNITNTNGSSGGKIKGSNTSSIICGATGTLYFNQSGTDSVLRNLTVNNSKTITLGNDLKITGGSNFGIVEVASGATLVTNGYLTLRSFSGGSAVIGNSPGTISGTIHVETFIPSTAGRRYRFIAPPVTGATATHWRENGNNNKYKGLQITGSGGSTNGFDQSLTNNSSAFYFNESNAGNDVTIGSTATDDGGWTAFTSGCTSINQRNRLSRICERG